MPRMKPVQSRIPATGSTSGAWLASRSDGHRLHAGVDLLGQAGAPVVAPEGGTVRLVYASNRPRDARSSSPAGWAGYGPRGVLLHGDSGAWHNLAHLGTVEVSEGSVVAAGQRVGTISDLTHCHWEVRVQAGPTGRAAIAEISADPAAWLEGRWELYDGRCPTAPIDDLRTPRACRPGWRGPAPRPFRHPVPVTARNPHFEVNPSELVLARAEGGSHGSR